MKTGKIIPPLAIAAVFALIGATPAFAQTDERPVRWHIAGGYSETTGRTSDYLQGGWIVSGGLTWRPQPTQPWALRLDAHYSDYDATTRLINEGTVATQRRIDDGNGSTLGLDLNGVLDVPFGESVRGYVTAGVGIDRRRVELTQLVLFNGVLCDPWWGFCGIGAVAGDRIVASDTTTRFAWNAGLGVEFELARSTMFVQATYHRIETARPTEYVPIEVGLRF
jgi:opacity protein-like surface antigen